MLRWTVIYQAAALAAFSVCCPLFAAEQKPVKDQAENPKERVEKWEPAIQAFEKQDAENPPAAGGVVFIGSSSIRRWDLSKSFGKDAPLNRGFGGSRTSDVNQFADRLVLKYKPRAVVYYAGDNDLAGGIEAKQVAANFAQFCNLVHAQLPETKIAFISIKPSPKRRQLMDVQQVANGLVREQCKADERLVFVDLWTPMLDSKGEPRPELFVKDMLHLNNDGYKIWAEKIKPLLAVEKK
jgi:lysophospholipase L1-like esterase